MAQRRKGKDMEIAKGLKASGKVGPRSGFVRLVSYVTPEQLGTVVAEAQRRAAEKGSVRADASAVVRDALALWMTKRRDRG
jgi:hypothetical protein